MLRNMLSNFLARSNRIHLRTDPAPSAAELIELIDRFLDGTLKHEMEWDDFISWESKNPQIEAVRLRLGEYEPYLFSQSRVGMDKYREALIVERNRLASLLNQKTRNAGNLKQHNDHEP